MAIFNDKYIEKSPAKRVPGLNSKRAGTRVPARFENGYPGSKVTTRCHP